jgi:hypothetical protein
VTARDVLEAVDRIVGRGGDGSDVLRAAVTGSTISR